MAAGVRVVVDVFSGRANPEWTLSEADVDTLREKVRRLSTSGTPPTGSGGLGYRGFEVYRTDPGRQGRWLRIADRRVIVDDERGSHTYEDSEDLERWLQQLARVRGMESLFETGGSGGVRKE
jgi:hypothetical protein